jgi:hypothetical protein
MKKLNNQRIVYKLKTCDCGCRGRNPWHQKEYRRTVTLDESDTDKGTVVLPFSNTPVQVHRSICAWCVYYPSVVFDKPEIL